MIRVEMVEGAAHRVIGMRRQGRYEEIIPLLGELVAFAEEHGIEQAGPPAYIRHETDLEAAKQAHHAGTADLEVVLPVESAVAGKEGVAAYEIVGGPMARIIYMGPYEELEEEYRDFFAWLDRHGKRVAGPVREVFVNEPWKNPGQDPVVWIYAPVE
ncbi:MAG: GyrI-like domain-containing protein [Methanomicrobiaceae archaeon]|nr:GyrI-like domain-containing protein [Methanomicrobiaceae archaeon]